MDWDSEQFIAQVGVNGKLALGVADTGSCKTLMCERTAASLGLTVERARGNEFGSYKTPGGNDAKAYVGVVRNPIEVQFGLEVKHTLPHVWVLSHPHPLMLIGSEILRGGDWTGQKWNFDGLHCKTVWPGHVQGSLAFSRGKQTAMCPLLFCPAEGGRCFSTGGVGLQGLVGSFIHLNDGVALDDGLAPIGGQFVRHDSR